MADDLTRSTAVNPGKVPSAPAVNHDMPAAGPKKPHRGDVTVAPKNTGGNTHPGSNPTPKSK
jgi:hypothetical protein